MKGAPLWASFAIALGVVLLTGATACMLAATVPVPSRGGPLWQPTVDTREAP